MCRVRKSDKPKRCRRCDRLIAQWNKSGFCNICRDKMRYPKNIEALEKKEHIRARL